MQPFSPGSRVLTGGGGTGVVLGEAVSIACTWQPWSTFLVQAAAV